MHNNENKNMITPQQNSGRESDYGGAISGRGGGRGSYSDGDDALILDPELQVLWAAIDCYKPDRVKLKPVLKSFLPEYMPAIGDIDPMIKVIILLMNLCDIVIAVYRSPKTIYWRVKI